MIKVDPKELADISADLDRIAARLESVVDAAEVIPELPVEPPKPQRPVPIIIPVVHFVEGRVAYRMLLAGKMFVAASTSWPTSLGISIEPGNVAVNFVFADTAPSGAQLRVVVASREEIV